MTVDEMCGILAEMMGWELIEDEVDPEHREGPPLKWWVLKGKDPVALGIPVDTPGCLMESHWRPHEDDAQAAMVRHAWAEKTGEGYWVECAPAGAAWSGIKAQAGNDYDYETAHASTEARASSEAIAKAYKAKEDRG